MARKRDAKEIDNNRELNFKTKRKFFRWTEMSKVNY